jgi:hypothetical protein
MLNFRFLSGHLKYLWSQGDDFGEAFIAKFASDRAENACTSGVAFSIDEDGSIVIEPDAHATFSAHRMSGADDYGANYFRFFDCHVGSGIFDNGDNRIADTAISTITRAEDANTHNFAGTAIVSNG